MAGRWQGRTALVTGASSGVGLEIARALAGEGARMLLPVRDLERGFRAVDTIRRSVPDAQIDLCDLDLASLASVERLVAELRATPIDLYVMNAGIVLLGEPDRRVTEDGNELHFQTNFLGHFALTRGLLPQLPGTRIAVQGSLAAARHRLDWRDLQSEHGYRPLRAYAASKVALGLFALELARRGAADGFAVNLCHPGVVPDTGIAAGVRTSRQPGVGGWIARKIGGTPVEGARPALMALESDAPRPRFFAPSRFFGCGGAPVERRFPSTLVDPDEQTRMWTVAEQLVGEPGGMGEPAADGQSTRRNVK